MKPKWEDAPDGAGWLAMDGDGFWFWWWVEPRWHAEFDHWDFPEDFPYDEDGVFVIHASEVPDCSGEIDWDHAADTLEHRPVTA